MDSMIFPALRFSNVDRELTEVQVQEELVALFQAAGLNILIHLDQISLHHDGTRHFAIVRGIRLSFGDIKVSLAEARLGDRDVVFSHDYGDARREDGAIVNPLGGSKKQLLDQLFMMPRYNIRDFFVPDLQREIAGGHYTNKLTMTDVELVNPELIQDPGRVLSFLHDQNRRRLFVEYFSLLEKLQALCLLNGNEEFAKNGHFQNCDVNRQSGLGLLGSLGILDVERLVAEDGYIRFKHFRQELIRIPDAGRSFRSCYKCDERGQIVLVGVTPCLKYYAAECSRCDYSLQRDPLRLESAVRFNNETFSRVIIERNDLSQFRNHEITAFNLVHTPLKLVYDSPQEARNIICPIVQHEAYISGKQFTLGNEARGEIVEPLRVIETLNPDAHELEQECLYFVAFQLPRTVVWSPESIQRFHHVTVEFFWRYQYRTNAEFRRELRQAKIVHMEAVGEAHVIIRCHMVMFAHCLIQQQEDYSILPYAPQYDYEALRQTMSVWVNNPNRQRFQFMGDLLLRHQLPLQVMPVNPLRRHPALLLEGLNEAQRNAVLRCQRGKLTVVQGPPGTGKTHTAAWTVLEIARTEPGIIICAAPSNEAANNLCNAIQRKLNENDDFRYAGIEVCRMTSVKKQFSFIRRTIMEGAGADFAEPNTNFRFLHQDIVTHPWFWQDENLVALYERIERRGMDDLTTLETALFNGHISDIGADLLSKMRILVTTVASLNDGRIQEYLADRLDELGPETDTPIINTLLLDEAGVIPMPQAIPIFCFRARRFLLFGDQEQLPPQVTGYSADMAGLSMSIMLYLQLAIVPNNPTIWRTLLIQYRMNPAICDLVSRMSYGGQLQCGPNIAQRQHDPDVQLLRERVNRAVPDTKNLDVVVFEHRHPEAIHANGSKSNVREAEMVIRLAQKLVGAGVRQDQIVIITPYEAQRGRIRDLLQQEEVTAMIRCVNVDAFQGREADVVILSFVRSNGNREIGFCKSQNRLNVMLSRARHFQFYVGNMRMITAGNAQRLDYHVRHIRNALEPVPRPNLH